MRDSPSVLALPPLAVVLVVQPSDSLTQRLDTGRGAIFSSMARDIDLLGPLEATLNLIVDFWGTLTQVGPRFWVLEVTVLVSALRGPYDTGGRTCGVETGVGFVAFVRAELTVDLGGELCEGHEVLDVIALPVLGR